MKILAIILILATIVKELQILNEGTVSNGEKLDQVIEYLITKEEEEEETKKQEEEKEETAQQEEQKTAEEKEQAATEQNEKHIQNCYRY